MMTISALRAAFYKSVAMVAITGEELVITKHGRPLFKVKPLESKPRKGATEKERRVQT